MPGCGREKWYPYFHITLIVVQPLIITNMPIATAALREHLEDERSPPLLPHRGAHHIWTVGNDGGNRNKLFLLQRHFLQHGKQILNHSRCDEAP